MQIERIGIIGLDKMGSGIAQVVADAGYDVDAFDIDERALEVGKGLLRSSLDTAVESGTLTNEKKDTTLARITFNTDMSNLKASDLIIEALQEDMELKKRTFSELSGIISDAAVLATTTTYLSVTEIAQSVKHKHRLLGLHFFMPPQEVKLVEVVRAERTSQETIDLAYDFCHMIGMEPVLAKDSPGFIVNHLWVTYMNEALEAYDHGLATKEDLDLTLEMGLGYPMGPLKLIDQIGLDDYLKMATAFYEESKDPKFAPPVILNRMVRSGKLGKKTGEGFYSYTSSEEGEQK